MHDSPNVHIFRSVQFLAVHKITTEYVTKQILAEHPKFNSTQVRKAFQRQAYRMISQLGLSRLTILHGIFSTLRQKIINWRCVDDHFFKGLEGCLPYKIQASLKYIGQNLPAAVWSVCFEPYGTDGWTLAVFNFIIPVVCSVHLIMEQIHCVIYRIAQPSVISFVAALNALLSRMNLNGF
eukprot:gnl/MRDRNA2_/MRDRNA2_84006_c0_seq8.p1 gnl/MRDRNA2_/MRDRNA2_84006_c0~~gnl/MRDRNA2_/MRDRNA2_84006_c0_seq8.p1  ORF type:complete len:180 (-),score=6.49 gnl/MRDRNA2_/MRDRNA2_84006_c0_seq8:3-542(-)